MRFLSIFTCVLAGVWADPALAQPLGEISEGDASAGGSLAISGDDAVGLAQRLYDQGRLDEAEAILRTLVDADPDKVDVMQVAFLAGLIAVQRKNYAEAEEIFRTILDHDPSLVRVRLELARVLFVQKKDGAASYHFHLALADGLPAPVEKKIRKYLSQIERRKKLRLSWSSSIVPSTNINAGSDVETVTGLVGLPITFQVSDDRRRQSGIGFSNSLSLSAFPKLSKHWRLRIRGSIKVTDYERTQFDDAFAAFEIGPSFRGKRYSASLLATATKRQFAGDDYSTSLGGRLVLSSPLSERSRFSVRVAYAYARHEISKEKDGPIYSLGATFQRALSQKTTAALSGQVARTEARDKSQKNTQIGLTASLRREMPRAITIQLSPQLFYRTYDGIDPLFPLEAKREDILSGISVMVTKRDWRIMRFAPVFSYSYLNNNSNNDFYSYERHAVDMGLTQNF